MKTPKVTFRLRNQLSEVDQLSRRLQRFAECAGLSRGELNSINLAIEVLFANVVNHGYKDSAAHWVEIRVSLESDHVAIRMSDDGIPFNPASRKAPNVDCPLDRRTVGGLGIHLCRNLMDEIRYERQGPMNIVYLKKKIQR